MAREFKKNNHFSIMQAYWDLMVLLDRLKVTDGEWYATIDNDKWKIVMLQARLREEE